MSLAGADNRSFLESHVKVDTPGLNEKLRSCFGISDSELSEIRKILEMARKDLMAYDVEIHRLMLRKEALKKYADGLSTLLSPIRSFPNEILSRIFFFRCEQNDIASMAPGEAAALTLSAVCTRWRALCLASPSLWSTIRAYFPIVLHENDESRTRAAQIVSRGEVHLTRSQNCPLTLEIDPVFVLSYEPFRESPFVRESQRWKHLLFRGEAFNDQWYPCLKSLSLPILETAHFAVSEFYPVTQPDRHALDHAPLIKELDIRAFVIDEDVIESMTALWSSLTSLSYLVTQDVGQFLPVLDRCPNLLRLELYGENKDDNQRELAYPSDEDTRILRTLPLTFLKLSSDRSPKDFTFYCILSFLIAPNLTELVLDQITRPNVTSFLKPFSALDSFFARSKCRLTILTLHDISLSDEELVSLLLRLPHLQELSVGDTGVAGAYQPISTAFIESLHTWKQSSLRSSIEPLIPKLRCLRLQPWTELEEFDSVTFVETIISRWLPDEYSSSEFGVVCLRSVELILPEDDDDGAIPYEPLRQLEKAGMRIVVKCSDSDEYII